MARASNPRGTAAMWMRDRLDELFVDEDFVACYPADGRPGLSPARLALVSVLQYVENLTDRQAAEAVRCRLDWKYCLGLELDDAGFDFSVLSEFRDRLAEGDRADRLLAVMVERLAAAGLVKRRGRVRTDSTHVLAAVRRLNRGELSPRPCGWLWKSSWCTARNGWPHSSPRAGVPATAARSATTGFPAEVMP
ncbi:transposase [Streptomyces avidinii]|uniref:transposase n=1 Tax=Streptomyces avidinii TaxID=1895 RepID=UPI00378E962F